jgi:L-alanine-DL-glutamate epimerase-like enolase superfamily enzyme
VDADKITRVETFPLRIPFTAGTWATAAAAPDRPPVDSLLIRVTTAEGYQGWGEALAFEAAPMAAAAVTEVITPLVIGQDARQIGPLIDGLHRRLHVLGRAGSLVHALSALDIALWDIAGQAAGVPLHRLLGGGGAPAGFPAPALLPCYASLDPLGDAELVRAGVADALAAGFGAVKLHERDVPVVYAARDEAGTASLMLDVNCAWTPGTARQRAAELAGAGLTWLEEPLWPPEDYRGLARLRAAAGMPLAAGENVTALHDFDRLLSADAVDVVQPSPAKMGGVSGLCQVLPLAAVRGAAVVPHTYYHGPGLLAALHVMAALGPPDALIEWRYSPLEALPYGTALLPQRGRLAVPDGPGLGLTPDPEVLRACRRP